MNEEEEASVNSLAVMSIRRYVKEHVEMFQASEIESDIDSLTESDDVGTDDLAAIVELVLDERVFVNSDTGKTNTDKLNEMLARTLVRVAPNIDYDEVVTVQRRAY